jgi:hypothetical protein
VIVIVATLTAVGTSVIDPIHGIPTEIVTRIVLIHGIQERMMVANHQYSPL